MPVIYRDDGSVAWGTLAIFLMVLIVILLRLAWTAGEVLLAAIIWWLPGPRRNSA